MVSVIVVNRDGEKLLRPLLSSLLRQSFADWELVFFDNASSDRSIAVAEDMLGTRCRWTVVRSAENAGFARANNEALASASPSSRYVFLLNNDTVLDPSCLAELVSHAERFPAHGIFSPQLLREGDPPVLDSAGIGLSPRGRGKELLRGRPPLCGGPFEIFGAPGAAMLFRREILSPAGPLFDEAFFFNNEDVDLALRWFLRGHRCLLVPAARLVHVGSRTSSGMPDFRLYHIWRNQEWVFARLPAPWLAALLPFHAADLAYAAAKAALGGRLPLFLRAKRDAFARLAEMRAGREPGIPGSALRFGTFLLRDLHRPDAG